MNEIAAPHASTHSRFPIGRIVLLVAAAMLLLAGLPGTTSAGPVDKDGKINACYRVKGKPKGALRVLANAKKRCKRGERKVVWSVTGSSGQAGGGGQSGSTGSAGSTGSNGAPGEKEANLSGQISSLALQVEGLENLLKGVDSGELDGAVNTVKGLSNGDLTGVVDTLDGVTNGELNGAIDTVKDLTNNELLEAVDSLPAIDAVCEQNEELTKQVNLLQGVVGGLGLSPALKALGLLEIPTLPTPLAPFACPAS